MKQILIIVILALLRQMVFAQHPDRAINDRINYQIKALQKDGVDTLCIYQEYCVGCEVLWKNKNDRCDYQGYYISADIYWKKNGLTYMTAKNNCFDYSTATIAADSLWAFYFNNINEIRSEIIKGSQYKETENGTTKIFYSSIDHSSRENITMIVHGDTVEKDFNDFDFEKTLDIAGRNPNINYEYNQNTKSKKLQLLLNSLTKEISKRKLLSKIN
jgi:hypothetical protein